MIDDGKSIIDHVHDYETICTNIATKGIVICEYNQAIILIEKLPSS